MNEKERRQNAQATLAAHMIARHEAEAWTAARDHIALSATDSCRDVLGMSIRETAKELGISRSTLARTLWKGRSEAPAVSGAVADLMRKHLDAVWIKVGRHQAASPEAQYEAGLIDEFERDALLDGSRRARIPIDEQIRDVVRRFPGIDSLDLPRMIVMAARKDAVPDLRDHAEDAECLVDGGRRWWPSKYVRDLQPGDEIPRYLGKFEESESYEWMFVESVTPTGVFGDRCVVAFQYQNGDGSSWPDCAWDERQPVRSWADHGQAAPAGFLPALDLRRIRVLVTLHGRPETIASARAQGKATIGETGLVVSKEDAGLIARFVSAKMEAEKRIATSTTASDRREATRKLEHLLGAEIPFPTDIVAEFFDRIESILDEPWSEYLRVAQEIGLSEYDCQQLVARGRRGA